MDVNMILQIGLGAANGWFILRLGRVDGALQQLSSRLDAISVRISNLDGK